MSAEKYVEVVFLNYIRSANFDELAGGRWIPSHEMEAHFENGVAESLAQFGFDVGKRYRNIAIHIFSQMKENGFIASEGDEFTGKFNFFSVNRKDGFVDAFLKNHEIANRIKTLGEGSLRTALSNLAVKEGWDGSLNPISENSDDVQAVQVNIPASDRVVSLQDNQSSDLLKSTDEIIQTVESSTNAIDGDVGLRVRLLGQLKAARELLISGIFKVDAIRQTLLDALQILASKYENELVGALASALLAELIKVIF